VTPSSAATPEPPAPKRRNWLLRRVDAWTETAQAVRREPRSALPRARDAAIALWSSRGGGFYGLGYVVAFVVLEIRTVVTGFATSDDVIGFIGQEIVQTFFRVAFESLVNTLLAFVWPFFVLQALEGWGVLLLVAGWWAYGRWAVPWVRSLGVESRRPHGRAKTRRKKRQQTQQT
jgi:hypothetical protein